MPAPAHEEEEIHTVGGTPFIVASISSTDSSSFPNIDLTQDMLDEESRRKILGKKQKLKNNSKERKHHVALLEPYGRDSLSNVSVEI